MLPRERPQRGLYPRELRDLQARVRSEQQTFEWKARHAVRSGVEGTINEFAHGHGMRRCRYRGQPKAHLQHVLTAIAVNNERLSGLTPVEEPPSPRPPTAFQSLLDQHEIPPVKVLANPQQSTSATKIADRVKLRRCPADQVAGPRSPLSAQPVYEPPTGLVGRVGVSWW
ncbi:transposase [Streptomyces sp. NPDC020192]|uniref:transposase n=1 Tax=Streptomyces sp. NPDC020192 TaxID=3365066 RepID=UPI0037931FCD